MRMAMPEQFSLRWNDFHSNLSQGFHALLEDEDLVDVTLAAEGQYVHAHKLILSVCSPYFKELFKMNPCEHPIVILKDVALSELRQLLQFMYKGEVHVRQQELSGFLHTAELLQIKGLSAGREKSESPPPQHSQVQSKIKSELNDSSSAEWVPGGDDTIATESLPTVATQFHDDSTRSPLKRLLKNPSNKTNSSKKKQRQTQGSPLYHENIEYASDGEPLIDCDNELYHSVLEMPDSAKEQYIKQEGSIKQDGYINIKQEGFINIKQEGGWNCKTTGVKCPSCHRFFANRYNLKVHIRDKHDTLEGTLQCEICHKRMRNPSCLRVHMYHHRKQAAFLAAQLNTPHRDQAMMTMGNKWQPDASISPTLNSSDATDLRDQDGILHTSVDDIEPAPSTNDFETSEIESKPVI